MTGAVWVHTHLPRLTAGQAECLSVKVAGEKIRYTDAIRVHKAEFRVSEKGRQRTLRTRVRNVHAWVVGEDAGRPYVGSQSFRARGYRKAVYDPFKGGAFVDDQTFAPVYRATGVIMVGKDVWYR